MIHWAKLRDAQELMRAGNYTGDPERLKEVFELLDKDQNDLLDGHELLGILEKKGVDLMMRETAAHRAKFKAEKTGVDKSSMEGQHHRKSITGNPSSGFKKL